MWCCEGPPSPRSSASLLLSSVGTILSSSRSHLFPTMITWALSHEYVLIWVALKEKQRETEGGEGGGRGERAKVTFVSRLTNRFDRNSTRLRRLPVPSRLGSFRKEQASNWPSLTPQRQRRDRVPPRFADSPVLHGVERVLIGDVVHEQEAHGSSVVGRGDGPIALLARCVLVHTHTHAHHLFCLHFILVL